MTAFDTVIVADWSARSAPSPKRPTADAIWVAVAGPDGSERTAYLRTRAAAMDFLAAECTACLARGHRVLAGFDFPFAYPTGFARALTGSDDPLGLWDWLADRIEDDDANANNRFRVADAINAALPGIGPFWGRPATLPLAHLPDKGSARRDQPFPERRGVERALRSAQPAWKLYTTGSVGSQTLLGLPRLAALRRTFSGQCAVWPFEETGDAPLVLAEIYPSLLATQVDAVLATDPGAIKDEVQVLLLARALRTLSAAGTLDLAAPDPAARIEGWILGAGDADALRRAARPAIRPPRLRNDCFALPPGVDWIPVDTALATLRDSLTPITGTEMLPVPEADGRILAAPQIARRANPPAANAAVDGYGFAHAATGDGPQLLPLHPGRAAAGAPFDGAVPVGSALRILTGAVLPEGVDTVVLEEDTTVGQGHVAFEGPVKPRANARRAGEDVDEGDTALPAGRRLGPQDLALLTALGVPAAEVHRPLRVGVLSTGDELAEPTEAIGPGRIFDANRPMLLGLADRWGHAPRDLGIAADDRGAVRAALDEAAGTCDAILTSGGASAGDEDHISAILRAEGTVAAWRIALKPGRPLLLGLWNGVPVFGMPGNPVAAFVCALIFARPALSVLAGGPWTTPAGFDIPAAFAKRKKPGRREYLRARLTPDGRAEVFASEGSGRISGLSWADGLVEIGDGPQTIEPGDPVRYIPFASFGL